MRKLVYGALALSAAMAVAFGANVKEADAASASITGISATGDTLTISTNGVDNVFVGVPTLKKGSDTAMATVANWDYYTVTNGSVNVNISGYAINKDNYLMVKYDYQTDDEAVLVKIPKTQPLTKASIDKENVITVMYKPGTTAETYKGDDLVYYTDNGETHPLNGTDGKYELTVAEKTKYQQTGATLYIRAKEAAAGSSVVSNVAMEVPVKGGNLALTTDGKTASDANTVKNFTVATRQSKAYKVTVSKLANAPKPKVDYVNGTITITPASKQSVTAVIQGTAGTVESSMKVPTVNLKENGSDVFTSSSGASGYSSIYAADLSKKTVLTVGTNILDAYGNFYVDLTAKKDGVVSSKTGRTVFKAQTATDIYEKGENGAYVLDEAENKIPLVKATLQYNKKTKGYDTIVTNDDKTQGYRVSVYKKDSSSETLIKSATVKAKGASATAPAKATIATAKIGNDVVANYTAVSAGKIIVKVEHLGNNSTMDLPGVAKELTDVEKVYTGDTLATFNITLSDALKGKVKVYKGDANSTIVPTAGESAGKGKSEYNNTLTIAYDGTEEEIKSLIENTNGKTKLADAKGIIVTGTDNKLIKVTKVESGDEGNKVVTVTFVMPTDNVVISAQ